MIKKGSTTLDQPAVNKSQVIRDYIAGHPDAPPKAIRLALSEQGVEVSDGLVGVVKYGGKKSKKAASAHRVSRRSKGGLSVDDLIEVKRLADELGGVKELRKALELLDELA